MKSDLVDLTVHVHHETDRAVLVSVDGNRSAAVWLPKTAIELERRRAAPTTADLTLPEQLAVDKGLV